MKFPIHLSALITLIITVTILAQTTIPGGNVSGTWTAAGSPYNVQGNITVPADSTLNIGPGVEVNFQGLYSLTVNGLLEAIGTEADSIQFTSSTYWWGINFTNAPDSSKLAFCIISHSGFFLAGMGGINCTNSNPVITHCRISDNQAHAEIPTYAGGIALNNSNAEISWCDIRNNQSGMCGGGLTITNSSPVITGCNISGNETVMYGGGIYITGNSSPIITNCTIEENVSNWQGGGILCTGGVTTMSECTIGYNESYLSGGGIYSGGGSVSLNHCAIEHNQCSDWSAQGGGIYANGGTLMVDHCTFYGDYVPNWDVNGMEIHTGGSAAMTVTNSILYSDGYLIVFGSATPASISYNDFRTDYFPLYFGGNVPPDLRELVQVNVNGDSCDVYSNIFMDPLFVGGGDFHLTEDSPCIDAGDPLSPLDPDSTITDMGRYYFDQSPPGIPSAVTDLTISCDSLNAHLIWSPVITDTSGNPITVSRYVIYASQNPNFIPTPSDSIGFTTPPDTSFMDTSALTNDKRFYNVKVIAGSR